MALLPKVRRDTSAKNVLSTPPESSIATLPIEAI
jgi:hypothetical protein